MCDFTWGKFALQAIYLRMRQTCFWSGMPKRTPELPPTNRYLKLTNEFTAVIEHGKRQHFQRQRGACPLYPRLYFQEMEQ